MQLRQNANIAYGRRKRTVQRNARVILDLEIEMTYIQRAYSTAASSVTVAGLSEGVQKSQESDRVFPNFSDLEVELATEDRSFWCYLKPQVRPSFTASMLNDLHAMQHWIVDTLGPQPGADAPIQWFVLASRTPGVFNLGGDLTLFSQEIRAGNRENLRRYAHSCVESGHLNYTGYNGGVVTIGLAEGDAFGGGWECLMSCDVLVAEKRARFALPESLFNMFPGMGASSYLTRRLGVVQAERVIMSGKVYTAEEMHALGAVDLVVENGTGVEAVRQYIQRSAPRHNMHSAVYKARRRAAPVTIEELRDIADIWVEAAFRLKEQDLRRMSHIAAAQDRQRRRMAVPAVAAE
jgi:DSF synthase